MVKAELHYNPYSLHTEVRFNGRKPRINSLVEKYIEGKLEDWVDQIPEIFCGEMNGYGFELDFSGTSLDFEELKRSFQLAGVDEKQVFLFLKNELEARETKLAEIRSMLDWLNQIRDEKFDFDSFKIKYPEIFDRTINLDLINGPFLSTSTINGMEISVDNISELSELDETNLSETPIVFWVDADRLVEFQKNLTTILSRKDIDQGQLFFKFADNVDPESICEFRNRSGQFAGNPELDIYADAEKDKLIFFEVCEGYYLSIGFSKLNNGKIYDGKKGLQMI